MDRGSIYEKLPDGSYLRSLLDGKLSGVPLYAVNARRIKWGLPALPSARHANSGPGWELSEIFSELQEEVKAGFGVDVAIPEDCTCPQLRATMDSIGPTGCRARRDELIDDIQGNVRKLDGIAEMTKAIVVEAIPRLFDEAVKRAEVSSRKVSSVTSHRSSGCCGGNARAASTRPPVTWSYGVTTLPSRRDSLLPITLKSLAAAGFDRPRLFVDGCGDQAAWSQQFGLETTCRHPRVGVVVNWFLALCELMQRDPAADCYAIFQDDCVAYRNLRKYLEKTQAPDRSYLNLITEMENEKHIKNQTGWCETAQRGRGAVALVFSRDAASLLLSDRTFIEWTQDRKRSKQGIDGGVVTAMNRHGWKEYCHAPSLVQHIGHKVSTMHHAIPQAKSFRGEEYDALSLL